MSGIQRPHAAWVKYNCHVVNDWLTCEIDDCDSLADTRYGRWCTKHLTRFRRHGDPLVSLGVGRRVRHGQAKARTRTYRTWYSMRNRCNNPSNRNYRLYGGRGITVCERWDLFENFLADMGERPEGRSIDRIDPDGNYEPSNCRWATPKEQIHNRRKRS